MNADIQHPGPCGRTRYRVLRLDRETLRWRKGIQFYSGKKRAQRAANDWIAKGFKTRIERISIGVQP